MKLIHNITTLIIMRLSLEAAGPLLLAYESLTYFFNLVAISLSNIIT